MWPLLHFIFIYQLDEEIEALSQNAALIPAISALVLSRVSQAMIIATSRGYKALESYSTP